MARWIEQRNWFSCGPVALLNLQKWLGLPVTYAKDYNFWKEKCCCDWHGSPLSCFIKSLYEIDGIKITPRCVPSIEVIDQALLQGKIVVMKSAYILDDELTGHYFLITERKKNAFYCVNADFGHYWMTKTSFRSQWLQHYIYYCDECGIAPYAWIIRKTNL